MYAGEGLHGARRWRARLENGHGSRQLLQACVEAGAPLSLFEPARASLHEAFVALVDEGAPMRSLLLALRTHDAGSPAQEWPYLARLLAAFTPAGHEMRIPAPAPTLLSEREQAVLQLMAVGRSVEEMAASLIISAHTVRTHVKNIYLKLDAHNRVQALERARVLRLL